MMHNKLQRQYLKLAAFPLALLFLFCSKNPASSQPGQVAIIATDPGVTDARLIIEMRDTQDPAQIALLRDGVEVYRDSTNSLETTTVFDSTLQPNHAYTYKAVLYQDGHQTTASSTINITTMDTTSHSFSWEVFSFGEGSGSQLNDVFIVNRNNIWAVGKIHVKDSTGNFIIPHFNAVHWDGQEWELVRFYKSSSSIISRIRGICHFSNSNIWLGAGSIYHWEGNLATLSYQREIYTLETVERLWRQSESEIYGVGNAGLMVYYNGRGWQTLESNTTLPIKDIWGAVDPLDNEQIILSVAAEKLGHSDKKIIQINPQNQTTSEVEWPFQNKKLHSVWFNRKSHIWVCGSGAYLYRGNTWKRFNELPPYFLNRIRGNDINDLFVVGDFGMVAHFNGINWKVFPEVNFALYHSLDYKDDIMVAVGQQNGRGYLLKMVR